MSQINLIIIKNNQIYHHKCGFRFILNLINKDFKFLDKFLNLLNRKHYKEDGYFLIDFDDKLILSNQQMFSSNNISSEIRQKLRTEFEYHEKF